MSLKSLGYPRLPQARLPLITPLTLDSMMLFENDSKPLFDIALSDVAAATVNKNEVQLPSPITRMRYSSPISLFSNKILPL